MEYMNNKALADPETSLKFAMLFSSRSFDALAMNETKVRCTMLKILETNFMNAEIYRKQDRNRLYNSITMLGEYYHRVRLADNSPVKILGESLLTLLQQELMETQCVDVRLAKLILSQITLNGRLLDARHQPQLAKLFFYIRCQLIEKPSLTATVKALLLMTMDMYYSNFQNLSKELEDLYTKYFLQGEQEEAEVQCQIVLNEHLIQHSPTAINGNHSNSSYQETSNEISTPPEPTTTKKWSEQVCEDSSFNENAFAEIDENPWNDNEVSNFNYESYKQTSPRSKHVKPAIPQQQQQINENTETNKPMPRWRAPRFNREANDTQTHVREQLGRRLSGNYDDDEHSVRSEGGNIRLYSINDRLKHSQEKIERIHATSGDKNSQNYYNAASIANSNWDRQSQRDDRSERSYMSNYERGHIQTRRHTSGGRHAYNNNGNKQIYDKPPRFQKQQQQQQQQQHHHNQHKHNTDSWRRRWPGRGNSSPRDEYHADKLEDDVQSHSSTRARTLPRPYKGNFDKDEQQQEQQQHIVSTSYRRRSSQSPGQFSRARNYRQHNNNNNNNNNNHHHHNQQNPRYGSQNSLASEASSVYNQRQHSRPYQNAERQLHGNINNKNARNFNKNHYNNHHSNKNGLREDKDWNNDKNVDVSVKGESGGGEAGDVDREIVKNARQTTNYMNYLSQK